ncbi:hypothetical protein [Dermatobacter hominis]|uniref:hypothetical protein n=1 Tax=Dermatobacter hominis TaxID=2884263 RepID=UPI001D10AB3E|nr:hypothetical protein [Dermatobacter hominis]UDY33943.1 hypothetical protein LH044_11355 [Dermatobacter hominis]
MSSGARQPNDLPVGFDADFAHVCVADGTTADLELPFFSDTVRALARTAPHARLEPIGELGAVGGPGQPLLLVFHVGRSGSTLLARAIEALSPVVVLREPEVLTAALRAMRADLLPAPVLPDLVSWFAGFAADRGKALGIKWPSTMSEFAPELLDLFPGASALGIVRDPVAVLRSAAVAPPTTGVPIAELVPTLPQCERLLRDAGHEFDLGSFIVGVWAVAVDAFIRLAGDGRLRIVRYESMIQQWPAVALDVAGWVGDRPTDAGDVARMLHEDQKALDRARSVTSTVPDPGSWAHAEADRLDDLIRPRVQLLAEMT